MSLMKTSIFFECSYVSHTVPIFSLQFIASLFTFCYWSKELIDIPPTIKLIQGCLFIFGGLLYFLGYMIHAATYQAVCDHWYDDYWWWECDDGI